MRKEDLEGTLKIGMNRENVLNEKEGNKDTALLHKQTI